MPSVCRGPTPRAPAVSASIDGGVGAFSDVDGELLAPTHTTLDKQRDGSGARRRLRKPLDVTSCPRQSTSRIAGLRVGDVHRAPPAIGVSVSLLSAPKCLVLACTVGDAIFRCRCCRSLWSGALVYVVEIAGFVLGAGRGVSGSPTDRQAIKPRCEKITTPQSMIATGGILPSGRCSLHAYQAMSTTHPTGDDHGTPTRQCLPSYQQDFTVSLGVERAFISEARSPFMAIRRHACRPGRRAFCSAPIHVSRRTRRVTGRSLVIRLAPSAITQTAARRLLSQRRCCWHRASCSSPVYPHSFSRTPVPSGGLAFLPSSEEFDVTYKQ